MKHGRDRPVAYWLSNVYPVAFIAAGVIVAVLLPQSWGPDSGPLSGLTRFVSGIVPSIAKFGGASAFPGVTSTYLAFLWTLLPLLVWASKWMLDVQIGAAAGRTLMPPGRRNVTNAVVLILAGVMFFSLMVVFPIVGLPVSPQYIKGGTLGDVGWRAFSQSRAWLGFLGALMVWMCSVGIAMLLRVLTMCRSTDSAVER